MDKEYILITIQGKEYILSSPQAIPQDVRNAIAELTLGFQDMIADGSELDDLEKDALKEIPNLADALFFIFLRKLTWYSGGWDFTPIPIGIRAYPA
jgi:hypothetical protein